MVCRWRGSLASSSAEDGAPKMGAHGAGRAACHASSPEWAVKRPLALSPRCKTTAFLRLFPRFFFYFYKGSSVVVVFLQVPVTFYFILFTHAAVEICSFCRKKKSHHTPFSMHTASSAFEVCVAMLRCVTYSILLQRSSAGDRMSHSEENGLRVS